MNTPAARSNLLKRATRWIAPIFYISLVVFLALYLRSLDSSSLQQIEINWYYLALAMLIGVSVRYWGAYVWYSLLRSLGAKNIEDKHGLAYVYAKSWMGRYIPGTAPWILGKIYFASKHGVSKNKLAVSSLLEGGLQVTVVMALAFLMLMFDVRLNDISIELRGLMTVVLIACLIALVPAVFNKIVAAAYRIVRRKPFPIEHQASTRTILSGVGLYTIWSILGGLSLFFIAKAVAPSLGYDNLLFVMGAGNLAAAVSMLAFFAPSGIGVREGIHILLLGIIMPAEIALIVTIMTRLMGVIMDITFFFMAKVSLVLSR